MHLTEYVNGFERSIVEIFCQNSIQSSWLLINHIDAFWLFMPSGFVSILWVPVPGAYKSITAMKKLTDKTRSG